MNLLDIGLLGIVGISLLLGYRRGFILGAYEIVSAAVGLLAAARLYQPVASVLALTNLHDVWCNVIAFVAVYLAVQIPAFMIIGPVVRLLRSATGVIPGVHLVDRLAGVVPGLVRGLLIASIVTLLLGFFPTTVRAGELLDDSRFGLWLYRESTEVTLSAADATGFQLTDFYAVTPRAEGSTYILPFKVEADDLRVDLAAEQRMLELLNAERLQRGLNPLQLDPRLSAIARSHAAEMFQEGYFAHQSPITGTPFDRLNAAGIDYTLAGENLAFAQSVDDAHQGLMDSPGHRANILEPGYDRVGIGAVSSKRHGTMYAQLFVGQ